MSRKRWMAWFALLGCSALFALLACIGLWTVIGWIVTGSMSW